MDDPGSDDAAGHRHDGHAESVIGGDAAPLELFRDHEEPHHDGHGHDHAVPMEHERT